MNLGILKVLKDGHLYWYLKSKGEIHEISSKFFFDLKNK